MLRMRNVWHLIRRCQSQNVFTEPFGKVTLNNFLPFETIPGPKRFEALGPLNELLTFGAPSRLHQRITALHKKYGPIFRVQMGPINSVFISSPDLMRSVFMYEGKYPKHPLPETWVYYNQKYNCKRGLFFMDDEEWLYYRKLLNPHFLRDTKWCETHIASSCDRMIDTLNNIINDTMQQQHQHQNRDDDADDRSRRSSRVGIESDNDYVEIKQLSEHLYKWTTEVILHIMLGKSYNDVNYSKLSVTVDKFSQIVHRIFTYTAELMAIPPKLADQLQLRAWKEFVAAVPETLNLAVQLIDTAIDELEPGDGLLMRMQEAGMSRQIITRIFADFILAAGDTTSYTTEWALYSLARNEHIQDMIREECNLENWSNLEIGLIKGTLKEVLRMYPVAPFIGRFLATDGLIGNYRIPQNTLAILSLYTAGRDDCNFTDSHKFLPQRWLRHQQQQHHCPQHLQRQQQQLKHEDNQILKSQATLPFAIGSRSCIGRKVAQMQIHYFLTKILKEFKLTSCNKKDVEMKMRLIGVPDDEIRIGIKRI